MNAVADEKTDPDRKAPAAGRPVTSALAAGDVTAEAKLLVSSSPHLHSGATVQGLMRDVLIALMPALFAGIWFFGWHAVRLTVICVASALAGEYICRLVMKRNNSLGDYSAALTGLLLALNLPPGLPGWMAAMGTLFAIVVAKQVFGGLGYNPFNPALIGRAFLIVSFTAAMTSWTDWSAPFLDATTTATPLGMVKEALKDGAGRPFAVDGALLADLFVGRVNGCVGETSALALLIGAAYLLYRRVITWHIPVSCLAAVAFYAGVLRLVSPGSAMPVSFHLFSGGLMLGAWYMATDMVTSPVSRKGMLVFGAGCGLLTMVIRTVPTGAYPEGVSFAILLMNALTPLINRATRPRIFGTGSRKKKGAA